MCPPDAMSMQPTCCAASTASTVAQWPLPGASALGRPRRIPMICEGREEWRLGSLVMQAMKVERR